MYGELVQVQPQPEPLPETPASTRLFVHRMVRNFGGARFKRSVQEGERKKAIIFPGYNKYYFLANYSAFKY